MDATGESGGQLGDASVSSKIVSEVAEFKDVDPLGIETPLYEVVDPDALDDLFTARSGPRAGSVEFAYAGCRVLVHSEGGVVVTEL